jgi:pilin isopeptide linkage protein
MQCITNLAKNHGNLDAFYKKLTIWQFPGNPTRRPAAGDFPNGAPLPIQKNIFSGSFCIGTSSRHGFRKINIKGENMKHSGQKLAAMFLAACMIVTMLPVEAFAQEPGQGTGSSEAAVQRVADGDSRYGFQDENILGPVDSTRYDGRVWTDKTVSTGDFVVTGPAAGTTGLTIEIGDDADFLVSYSAMATSTSIISQESAPVDLVLVLDMSPQINSVAGKAQSMLNAVKNAIAEMMDVNPKNRVAVVAYSCQSKTLLPLDRYEKVEFTFADNGRWSGGNNGGQVTCEYQTGGQTETVDFIVAGSDSGVNKYTQMGLYEGMRLLTDAAANLPEGEIPPQPALILLSEGEPKIASTDIQSPTKASAGFDGSPLNDPDYPGVEIWRNEGLQNQQSNFDDRHAQTFATLLTAAYMKGQVANAYNEHLPEGDTLNQRKMRIYTMGINMSTANSPDLAEIVLDPRNFLRGSMDAGNPFSDDFVGYAEAYFQNGSVDIINAGVNHLTTKFENQNLEGVESIADLRYNDGFYQVTGQDADLNWGEVFRDVISHVINSAPKVPTETGGGDLDTSGYITYIDPIGDYMEVKQVKQLIYNHQVFNLENPDGEPDADGNIHYRLAGSLNSPTNAWVNLDDIEITAERTADGRQQLRVRIPASLIPLRVNTVILDEDGAVKSNDTNNAYPLRLFYTVGLNEGIVDRDSGKVITEKVSDEYLETHTDENGNILFYAGRYTGRGADSTGAFVIDNPDPGSKTVGDAYILFTPAHTNPFYYVQENTPLFLDEKCQVPATDALEADEQYYFRISYYEGTETKTAVVSRTGASFQANDQVDDVWDVLPTGNGGQLEIQKGRPRLGYLTDFVRDKSRHYVAPDSAVSRIAGDFTGTASTFYYPTYVGDGEFKVYLGNNGRLTAAPPDPAVGSLTIQKTVKGEDAPENDSFSFQIELDAPDDVQLETEYAYTGGVVEGSGAEAPEDGTLELTDGVGTVQLKAGQTVRIDNLPKGTQWKVTENLEDSQKACYTASIDAGGEGDITVSGSGASGAINHHGDGDIVAVTNLYDIPTGSLVIQKTVTGEPPEGQDTAYSFLVELTLPDGSNSEKTVPVTAGTPYEIKDLPLGTTYQVTELLESGSEGLPGGDGQKTGEGSDGQGGAEGDGGSTQPQMPQDQGGAEGDGGVTQPQAPEDQGGAEGDGGVTQPQAPQDQGGAEGDGGVTQPQAPQGQGGAEGDNGSTQPQAPQDQGGAEGDGGVTQPQAPQDQGGAEGDGGAIQPQAPQDQGGAEGDDGSTQPQAPQDQGGAEGDDGSTQPQAPQDQGGAEGDGGAIQPQAPEDQSGAEGDDGSAQPQDPEGQSGKTPLKRSPAAEDGYIPLVRSYSGIIAKEEALTLPFVNVYGAQEEEGSLTIQKVVDGENPNPEVTFVFRLTFEGEGAEKLNQEYGDILLKAGESRTITGLPAGIAYRVREVENQGYTPATEEAAGVIAGGQTANVVFHNTVGETPVEPAIHLQLPPVEKWARGDNVPTDETFTFRLTGGKEGGEAAPMPERDTVSVTYEGHAYFGYVTFRPEDAGSYTYTITEEKGNAEGWTYDEAVYTLQVTVTWEDEKLSAATELTKSGTAEPQGEAVFYNDYADPTTTPPDYPRPNPDNDHEDGGGRPSGSSGQSAGQDAQKQLPDTGVNWLWPLILAAAGAALMAFAHFTAKTKKGGGGDGR